MNVECVLTSLLQAHLSTDSSVSLPTRLVSQIIIGNEMFTKGKKWINHFPCRESTGWKVDDQEAGFWKKETEPRIMLRS